MSWNNQDRVVTIALAHLESHSHAESTAITDGEIWQSTVITTTLSLNFPVHLPVGLTSRTCNRILRAPARTSVMRPRLYRVLSGCSNVHSIGMFSCLLAEAEAPLPLTFVSLTSTCGEPLSPSSVESLPAPSLTTVSWNCGLAKVPQIARSKASSAAVRTCWLSCSASWNACTPLIKSAFKEPRILLIKGSRASYKWVGIWKVEEAGHSWAYGLYFSLPPKNGL